jgi:hypothetical protein
MDSWSSVKADVNHGISGGSGFGFQRAWQHERQQSMLRQPRADVFLVFKRIARPWRRSKKRRRAERTGESAIGGGMSRKG